MAGIGFRASGAAWGMLTGAALGVSLGMAGPALADVKAGVDAWSAGIQASRSGDKAGAQRFFAEAIREWQASAGTGDADAQFNLAQAYKLGLGVPQDLGKAEVLYGKAAAQGHLQAADMYGLLLYQRGEHAKAMPFIEGAADRGDPRAQYVQGLALFNGDGAAKDWVRAYALVSLAQQAGLPQARDALAQMDKYIPLDQRQQAAALAPELAAKAEANRNRQMAAADLGVKPQSAHAAPVRLAAATPQPQPMPQQMPVPKGVSAARLAQSGLPTAAGRAAGLGGPANAGADFARPTGAALPAAAPAPRATPPAQSPRFANAFTQPASPRPAPAQPAPVRLAAVPAPTASGSAWRIQLGAFGVAANADAMWAKVKGRAEVAGHARLNAPSGKVTRLLATGYSEGEAQAACRKLSAAGISCLATKN
jgi:cell division septation protein DedD